MDNYTGRQIGHYRILRQLGTGAFATVYLAEHLYIERIVAIKILHVAMSAQSRRDFQEEARINARLEHPHIIRLLDFGFYEQMPYLVMEYALNGTLRRLYPKGSRMPLQQVVRYVFQIAEALDYAHQQNVIHRDVKPENLLLNSKNELVLSDFGIAIVQQTQQSFAAPEMIVGTPIYMAPEQFRGTSLPASDQYALGVTVYEWLCGAPPFSGNFFALSYQHVQQLPRPLYPHVPDISSTIDTVVAGALAKNPSHRFTSVRDFARALAEAVFATRSPSPYNASMIGDPLREKSPSPHVHTSLAPEMSIYENSTQTGLKESQQVKNQQQSMESIPIYPSSGGASLLQAVPFTSQEVAQNQNRQSLMRRVRSFWITGVLEQSLEGAILMELDLQETPDAVASPWKQIVPLASVSRIAEKRKSILQYYNDADAELLILGAPGSGKTTVLLTLARDLLTRAEQNGDHPVPVIFNLSTWSNNRPLAAWLVSELDSKYQVHPKLGQQLVKANLILPLLDGLDEVAAGERTACIEAINHYRREVSLSPLVVCSRSADYLTQQTRVLLNKAVTIRPLSMQQANDYLVQAGDSLQGLRVALQSETALRELMRTPLLLRMLTLTYYDVPVPDVLRVSSPGEQIQNVLERYIERMLTRGNDSTGYSPQATRHWLAWLARQLQQHNQKIFYIERLQPDCFEGRLTHQRYTRILIGLIFSVLGIVVLGSSLIYVFVEIHNNLILWGLALLLILANVLIIGLVNGKLYQLQAKKVSGTPAQQKWRRRGQRLLRGIVNVVCISLFMGLPSSYINAYAIVDVSKFHISTNLFIGLASLLAGVGDGFLLFVSDWLLAIKTTEIQPAEIIAWSWKKVLRNFFKSLGIGLFYDLLLGLLFVGLALLLGLAGLIYFRNIALAGGAVIVFIALIYTILLALLKGITSGLSTNMLDSRDLALPNQGIRRSARNSLLVGLGGLSLLIGLPVLVIILFKGTFALSYAFSIPLLLVLILALRAGGTACIQHMTLRWLLWREGVMPWNYPRFLDYAAEHILLQKVGGGYMFVHRFLLEYFASLETSPPQP